MSSLVASVAKTVVDVAEVVHRSAAPVSLNGGMDHPSFLKQSIDDIHAQIVNGKPFNLSDIPAYVDAIKLLNGGCIDDRLMLLEKLLVLMSRLPVDSKFAQSLQVHVIDILYKDLPHPPSSYLPLSDNPKPGLPSLYLTQCDQLSPKSDTPSVDSGYLTAGQTTSTLAVHDDSDSNGHADKGARHSLRLHSHRKSSRPITYAARSADGSGYNPLFPNMGKAGTAYARTVPPSKPRAPQSLPDPGLVFDTLLKRRSQGAESADDGFVPHPGGVSSLFFSFADLIIHCCFETDHTNWARNKTSSYLDLSPLYGSSQKESDTVRRHDGTGRLYEDVFVDTRVLLMPPSVCALLVLFCRNHNFIAKTLFAINENGTYQSKFDDDEQRKSQDDELFERSRLVNCGFFMQIILKDYVGAILGLQRDGFSWRLDPLVSSRQSNHEVSPRGEGNAVSIEFNLMYRWHATLSRPDTKWTEDLFVKVFQERDFSKVTVEMFSEKVGSLFRKIAESSPKCRTFDGPDGKPLERDENGSFKSSDLAKILQMATEAPASAFKARGTPEVLRIVEIMGIMQARSWGTCSLNEFRKFMGLKPYGSFAEWNPEPEIHTAAEALYRNIDDLELHVGLQAEESKPPIPGAGLCPGYTISRAILSDATALTRGDPFLTTEFTTCNLTSWGFQSCFPDSNDGSYGGMLTRLLFRTLPEYYPPRSVYVHFPFLVPTRAQEFLSKLYESPVKKYTFTRPPMPPPVLVAKSYAEVKCLLETPEVFDDGIHRRMSDLTRGREFDIKFANDAITSDENLNNFKGAFAELFETLIATKSMTRVDSRLKLVDIVQDVINLLPVYFVSVYVVGVPMKTESTPKGLYRDVELYEMFSTICNYVLVNSDPNEDWVLRERSIEYADRIIGIIRDELNMLSGRGVLGEVIHWMTGNANANHAFLLRVFLKGKVRRMSIEEIANSIFAATVCTTALYSKAIAHILDYYLHASRDAILEEIVGISKKVRGTQGDGLLLKFAREALRLEPPMPVISLVARKDFMIKPNLNIRHGQTIACSVESANVDPTAFGDDPLDLNLDRTQLGLMGLGDFGLMEHRFFDATAPIILRSIFSLKNLKIQEGTFGSLMKVTTSKHGVRDVVYMNANARMTPWPVSLRVQFKP